MFVFGYNKYGQLGLEDNRNKNIPTLLMRDETIRQIAYGKFHPVPRAASSVGTVDCAKALACVN